MHARVHGEESLESTILKLNVLSAKTDLGKINMQNPDFVQNPALCQVTGVKVKSLRKLEKRQNVYCLAAKKNGTMIANGIFTKNCDGLRYAIFSHFGKHMTLDYRGEKDDMGRSLSHNDLFHPHMGKSPF
jgi:hypothetical protein